MAMESNAQLIAACGLGCGTCDIRLVPFDDAAAERIVAWFLDMGWLEEGEGKDDILERRMYCQGCHGDRSLHWDAECWILKCCVDDRGHQHCSQCAVFPCEKLEDWAGENDGYRKALQRLRRMKRSAASR
jgi:hypothetical protein